MLFPAILILEKNKRYGKVQTKSETKSNKFWYRVKPYYKKTLQRCSNIENTENDENTIEYFVPYKLNGKQFSKTQVNKYIIFSCSSLNNDLNEKNTSVLVTDNKHYGNIEIMIGDVNVPENIYEYLLYCKLDYCPRIYKTIKSCISQKLLHTQNTNSDISAVHCEYNIKKNEDIGTVFTIDPENCTDFDDACSIMSYEDGSKMIGIHITNVPVYFDMYNLWSVFMNVHTNISSNVNDDPNLTTLPISSIYLPNKTIHMLPSVLSEKICSLKAKEQRIVFSMFIYLDPYDKITKTEFSNNSVYISRNFVYESRELLKFKAYQQLKKTCIGMKNNPDNRELYNMYMPQIHGSHEVIECLMIFMNMCAGQFCFNNQVGVFRSSSQTIPNIESSTENMKHVNSIMHSPLKDSLCEYKTFEKNTHEIKYRHVPLNISFYSHVTSPIRRIVDIINMTEISIRMGTNFKFFNDTHTFINNWKRENTIEQLNILNKSIRKIHNETKLIHLFYTDRNIQNKLFTGTCIEIESIPDDDHLLKYTIFFEELHLLKTIRLPIDENISLYSKSQYNIFLFKDQDNIHRKLCIQKHIKNEYDIQ